MACRSVWKNEKPYAEKEEKPTETPASTALRDAIVLTRMREEEKPQPVFRQLWRGQTGRL